MLFMPNGSVNLTDKCGGNGLRSINIENSDYSIPKFVPYKTQLEQILHSNNRINSPGYGRLLASKLKFTYLDVEIMLRCDKSNDDWGGDYTRRRLIATCDQCGRWFDLRLDEQYLD
ncbi:hypothetical protein Csa_011405 [Cucumis sativus]|uniref:Uncharacterized protein n=1 Tax=Cucumis sativus TaxID=3659 RepID=A0A0A0L482_CUCSA|nr:hypothetical protein Csa_011405 [Cucumis sativus]